MLVEIGPYTTLYRLADLSETYPPADSQPQIDDSWLTQAVHGSQRGKRNLIDPGLSRSDLQAMMHRCGGYCEVTGLPFICSGRWKDLRRNPFAPSVDRIDFRRGYAIDNCRLVLQCVNLAMNVWGEKVIRIIAEGYAAKKAKEQAVKRALSDQRRDARIMAQIAKARDRKNSKEICA